MIGSFEFATAGRIIFGAGSYQKLDQLTSELGVKPMRITGRRNSPSADFVVIGEPTVEMIREAVQISRTQAFDCVVAVGGGSVIDAARAIAGLSTNEGDVLDYIEVIGAGKTLSKPALPWVAVPTTAGTGSEVTRNAVIGSPPHGVKASLRSPYLLPRTAVVDPELTLDLPPALTASTGLDALTQLMESYLSVRANPLTDTLALEGIHRAASALPQAFHDGHDLEARTSMSYAALLGGLTLANAGLGVVHGFAAPIGGMFPNAPHGSVCAAILPHGIRANLAAARERSPQTIPRFESVAQALTGNANATADHAISFLQDLCDELQIPGLGTYGVTQQHIPELVVKAAKASSMKANPFPLTDSELTAVLTSSL